LVVALGLGLCANSAAELAHNPKIALVADVHAVVAPEFAILPRLAFDMHH
jgi:hypothetical protein